MGWNEWGVWECGRLRGRARAADLEMVCRVEVDHPASNAMREHHHYTQQHSSAHHGRDDL
jgi:hypothetical protein